MTEKFSAALPSDIRQATKSDEVSNDKSASLQGGRAAYTKLFILFLFGSVFGFVFEGLWSIIKVGHWENHSALVWGPFCTVYGFGAVAVYLISRRLYGKGILLQFAVFAVAGSTVEYFTSLFQELIFGSTSWDYSRHPFNIGGRISLQMAFVWGGLGVLFLRLIYPCLYILLKKLQIVSVFVVSIALSVFMSVNFVVSGLAVLRWNERCDSIPPSNAVEVWLDRVYNNERMESIYCNLKFE